MNNQSIHSSGPRNLLSPRDTAKVLGVSTGTLTVWRCVGRYNLPFVRVGRKIMYRPEDVQAFIDRRTTAQPE